MKILPNIIQVLQWWNHIEAAAKSNVSWSQLEKLWKKIFMIIIIIESHTFIIFKIKTYICTVHNSGVPQTL